MERSKAEYERLIAESPVFSISKEKEPSRYQKEALKLVEYLYKYLVPDPHGENEGPAKYEPYAVEIVEVAKRCIESFNPEKGVFLNYFNRAWKMEYEHLTGRELMKEQFHGMRIAEEQSRLYRKYKRISNRIGMDVHSSAALREIADAMGLTPEAARKLRDMEDTKPTGEIGHNDSDEETNILLNADSGKYVDERSVERGGIKEQLLLMQAVFDGLQNRQKPLISKLITAKLTLEVCDDAFALKLFQKMPYFDEEIFEKCIKTGSEVGAREISEMMGLAEASTSRSWKGFKEKLRKSAD